MKVTEIFNQKDAEKYLKNSTNKKKGYNATVRKFKLLVEGKRSYPKTDDCGICIIRINKHQNKMCAYCPCGNYCRDSLLENTAKQTLKCLKENREKLI